MVQLIPRARMVQRSQSQGEMCANRSGSQNLPGVARRQNIPPMSMKPIHMPSDAGAKLNVLGIPMLIRIHGRDSGGIVSAVESHDVTGGGPPPHIHHREDETFQIIEE